MTAPVLPDALQTRSLSLRDPAGCLLDAGDRLLRLVLPEAASHAIAALRSPGVARLVAEKSWIPSRLVEPEEAASAIALSPGDCVPGALWLEHPKVFFPSYPAEWAPEMLHEAARLTLRIAEGLLEEDLGIKDATPYNVLFEGPRPVFVDFLSVERRDPLDPSWLAFGQFARSFLYPLLALKHLGIPLDMIYLGRRDGLEPDELYRMAPAWKRFSPLFLPLVSVPVWLGKRRAAPASGRVSRAGSPAQARFILRGLIRHLGRMLERLAPAPPRRSRWSAYMGDDLPYTDEEFREKEEIVERWLAALGLKTALDVGCNTGHFSRLAAMTGAKVVSIDSDGAVVAKVWTLARSAGLDILPLRVDFARPTPAVGWRNAEAKSFLERAEGKFDGALLLAVVHHLMVTEGVPLPSLVSTVARLVRRAVIVEYVDPADPTFKGIARGRETLFGWLTPESFVSAWEKAFCVREAVSLRRPTRRLYLLERR